MVILACCHSLSILQGFLATESVDVLLFCIFLSKVVRGGNGKSRFFFSCYNINHLTLSGHSASLTRKIYSLYSNLLIFLFAIFHWKQPLFKIIDCLRHKYFYIYLFKKYFQIQSKRNFQTHSFKIVSFFKCIQIL